MIKRRIFCLFLVLWCIVIFMLSSQNDSESSKLSSGFITKLYEIINPGIKNLTDDERIEIIHKWSFMVRKAAHFTAYMILGMIFYGAFSFRQKNKKRFVFAILFSLFYAITDEIHQLYVTGRSGEIRDVMIDTSGAVVGMTLVICVINIEKYFKNKKTAGNE